MQKLVNKLTLFAILLIALIITGCNKSKDINANKAAKCYEIVTSLMPLEVSENIYLVTEYDGCIVTYLSSNEDVIRIDNSIAYFTYPLEDTFVTISISIKINDYVLNKEYTILATKQQKIDISKEKEDALNKCDSLYSAINFELLTDEDETRVNNEYEKYRNLILFSTTPEEVKTNLLGFTDFLSNLFEDLTPFINKTIELMDEYILLFGENTFDDEIKQIKDKYVLLINDALDIDTIYLNYTLFIKDIDNLFGSSELLSYKEETLNDIISYYQASDYSKLTDTDKALFENLLTSTTKNIEDALSFEDVDDYARMFYFEYDRLKDELFPVDPIKIDDIENSEYYNDIDLSLTGRNMLLALRSLMNSTHKRYLNYDDLKKYTLKTDADPNVNGNIILIYSRNSVKGTWDGGTTWNREHVWPQSKGWFKTSGAGADIHHLRPENPSVNTSRGNKPFGKVTNSNMYCPVDSAKGDVARIIFYLLVHYSESDNYPITNVAQSMELLLSWNELDPVDDLERTRNQEAYLIQGNRNPFIDYQDFANVIWGTVRLTIDTSSNEITIVIELNYCLISDINKKYYQI